jgi:hypothetical protein
VSHELIADAGHEFWQCFARAPMLEYPVVGDK